MSYDANLPPGCSAGDRHFTGPDAPDYDFDTAVSWIDNDDLGDDFLIYVEEHFKDVIDFFRESLHPSALHPDDDDLIGENWELFDRFVWDVLDKPRLKILVHAFTESNWASYEEYAS